MAYLRSSLFVAFLLLAVASFPQISAAQGKHFVFVHGLGHGAWCWYKVVTLLEASGHNVTTIDLSSNGISKVVADTITSIAEYALPLTDYLTNNVIDEEVILVGHSLGGGTVTYAMEMFPNKISKAIFLASVMPINGQSFFGSLPATVLPRLLAVNVLVPNFAIVPSTTPTSVQFNLANVKDYLYNQSPATDVSLAKTLLNPTPYVPGQEVLSLTEGNYGSIRRYYIKTTLDKTVLPSDQDLIVKANPPEKVYELANSDHSAFFSQPLALTKLLILISSS